MYYRPFEPPYWMDPDYFGPEEDKPQELIDMEMDEEMNTDLEELHAIENEPEGGY